MTQMIELSQFKITMINILKCLRKKIDNTLEQIGNESRELEILRKGNI